MTDTSTGLLANKSFATEEDYHRSGSQSCSESDGRQNLCVHQLIAAHAAAAPGALAVTQGETTLNYQELDERATALAHLLQSFGVGPDVLVAVYLNRSPGMIVAALAVLKAGGAYLPLDASYPAERLEFIWKDARPSVLVTGKCMLNAFSVDTDRVVIVDPEGRAEAGPSIKPAISRAPAKSNLAYVIYTSGSTGQPKGVEITHQSLLNLVLWHQRAFQVTSKDRASQLAALGFDAAVWEIWPYLAAGASIHLPCQLATSEPEAVRDWLVSQGITIGFLATPLAERAMTLEWPRGAALRVMLTGADTLHHYPPRSLRFQLVNNYGPTECTVVATSGRVLSFEHTDQLPSIGRPIDNVQIYMLDEDLKQVPSGEPGQIYIGGAGVARGYRNQPELTRERFITDPFSSDPNARIYKTGDLACWQSDGQISFLGRVDEQIKIRGFRIEPAEIVKALDEHPDVQASVVVAREVTPGDKRLVAYFVSNAKAQVTHVELRNFLAARLPEYMVPATFVPLQALPLNASGKVDRSALPPPSSDNTLRDNAFVAPRTPVEERIAGILAPLLGLDQVSMEDNFFFLGGHSLLGTQLIARVRGAFGVDLTLRSLFDAPTISALSAQVEALLLAKLEAMSEVEAQRLLEATVAIEVQAAK
jgi:amino acid adenylation domain-containing protein